MHDFSFKTFCLTVPKKFRWGTLRCIRKSRVAKNFMHQRGGRGYQDFPSKIFCLTVPKISVGGSFSVPLIWGVEKFYASEGYFTILNFLSKFFRLTVPKNFVGEPFCVVFQKISGLFKEFMDKRGGSIKRFHRKFFVSLCRKISQGNPLVCH